LLSRLAFPNSPESAVQPIPWRGDLDGTGHQGNVAVQVRGYGEKVTEKDGRFPLLEDGLPFGPQKRMRAFRQEDVGGQQFVELFVELGTEILKPLESPPRRGPISGRHRNREPLSFVADFTNKINRHVEQALLAVHAFPHLPRTFLNALDELGILGLAEAEAKSFQIGQCR
jgi:hypothetical protein